MEYECLKLAERRIIERLYREGQPVGEIAAQVGRNMATVYRELKRGSTGEPDENGRMGYSAELGEKTVKSAYKRRGRKKGAKQ